jgi:hypothetical protein
MLHASQTYYRYVLVLEGLWDQLEGAVRVTQRLPEQSELQLTAFAKLAACRMRCCEWIATFNRGELLQAQADARERGVKSLVAGVLSEVADALRCVREGETADWLPIAYQAQDAVLDALHTLRSRDQDYANGMHAIVA